ncbi:MAG: trehalase family glycosidase [Bacteroidota bacterium]
MRYLLFILFLSFGARTTIAQSLPEQNTLALLQGWNTWNNPSVLSHVLMPEGLNVQFSFRKKRTGPYWLRDAYIASPKYNFPEQIEPKEHAFDGSYTALYLEWEGVKASIQTARIGNDIVLLFSPDDTTADATLPTLVVETGFLWNKPGTLQFEENLISAKMSDQNIPIRYIGNRVDTNLPLSTPHFCFESYEEIAIYTGEKRTLEEIKVLIETAKSELKKEAEQYGKLSESYQALQSVIAWNQFYDAFNDRGLASVSRIWNEAWGGYIIFDWDTYFIGLMAALENKILAYANIFAITDAVTDNGFIPNVKSTYLRSNDRSQPPVGSLCVKMIYDRYGEKWFLEEVYEELLSWNRWWSKYRDNQGYLSWGSDPHLEGMSPHTKQAAKWESGLDNSPLFDEAKFDSTTNMLNLASVGLMSLYIADCKYLAAISEELEKEKEAKELRSRADQYAQKLNELWDEKTGIYRDKNLTTGEFSTHIAPTNLYPLLAHVPTPKQARRMVQEHLLNPDIFYGDWMIPSIARNDSAYIDNSYWRGRIWAPMNFLVYLGLRNYELEEAQQLIAKKSEALLMQSWLGKRRIHENYNADTGQGDDVRNSDPFYAWGALLAFIPLIEEGYFEVQKIK